MKHGLLVLALSFLSFSANAKTCANGNPNDCAGKVNYTACETSTGDLGRCQAYGKPDPNFNEYACRCQPQPEVREPSRKVMCDHGSSATSCLGKAGYSACESGQGPGRCAPVSGPGTFGDYSCECERN